MWKIIGGAVGGLFSSTGISAIGGIVKSIWGNKEAREVAAHHQEMKVQESYAAEFLAPEKKHWFNMLIDGINRLVRPIMTYGIIAMFIWAAVDPAAFYLFIKNIQIVPELMWWVFLAIITFWFGGRLFENGRLPSTRIDPSVARDIFNERADREAEMRYSESTEGLPIRPTVSDSQYQSTNSATKAMTNQAIAEWRKKKGK